MESQRRKLNLVVFTSEQDRLSPRAKIRQSKIGRRWAASFRPLNVCLRVLTMHLVNKAVALLLASVFLVSSPALAQNGRVVDSDALSEALASKANAESDQRVRLQRVLDREDVREVAARMGLNVEDASSAVATLSGVELSALAQHADAVEAAALAGGANTIVISVTTLLLLLIIVILLVN